MDELFWMQSYGDKEALKNVITDDHLLRFAEINYGPWDRLNGNQSFVDGIGEKPLGANFYPKDMTKEEFEAADLEDKSSLYTMVRRDSAGSLITIPYHKYFETQVRKAAETLLGAAYYAENEAFRNYLLFRAEALISGSYDKSDRASVSYTHLTLPTIYSV